MLAAYGSSGAGGSSAGYWVLVAIVVVVLAGLVVWGISRLRSRRAGGSPMTDAAPATRERQTPSIACSRPDLMAPRNAS
jgi:hypothetical protein